MCMQQGAIRPMQRWHWAGDQIVHDPCIPAARYAAGSRKTRYPIDIRSFLSIESNAVLRRWLDRHVRQLPEEAAQRMRRRGPGDFDFRAHMLAMLMGELRHQPARSHPFDQWQYPDETLALGSGDCEDLAFVLAALMLESGISADCVRVALGSIVRHGRGTDEAAADHIDHAWVMYLSETGAWTLIEPMARIGRAQPSPERAAARQDLQHEDLEYVPHFVFNNRHLWRVRGPHLRAMLPLKDYLDTRRADDGRGGSKPDQDFWQGFDPSFAAGVHGSLIDAALPGMPLLLRLQVHAESLALDVDTLHYDPRDHFDFAYIDEGWQRVDARLASGTLPDFARALHSIADFYAHSTYAHFAAVRPGGDGPGHLDLHDPAAALPFNPDYACLGDAVPASVTREWNGRLISGCWDAWYATYPDELRADRARRMSLPPHDRIAVDDNRDTHGGHLLYPDPAAYGRQFRLRRDAARRHMEAAWRAWPGRDEALGV